MRYERFGIDLTRLARIGQRHRGVTASQILEGDLQQRRHASRRDFEFLFQLLQSGIGIADHQEGTEQVVDVRRFRVARHQVFKLLLRFHRTARPRVHHRAPHLQYQFALGRQEFDRQ